jgi:NTE family protein
MGIMTKPTIALLLGGGGARAAYQVGLLKGIVSLKPDVKDIPFKIVCGTSAGAINATTLACFASNFPLCVRKLDWLWSNIHTEQIYHCTPWNVIKHVTSMFARNIRVEHANEGAPSLLNPSPLRNMLNNHLDFSMIDRQIENGSLNALSLSCSCYQSKRCITFFQSNVTEPWQRAKHGGQKTHLTIDHILASAAIPLIFPSVKIKDLFYGDGTIHQLAPLSAPIHLGADKVIVLSLDSAQPAHAQFTKHPTGAAIATHLLDTIFSDTLSSDVERLNRINQTLTLIPEKTKKKMSLKPIEIAVLKPSIDLGELTTNYYQDMPKTIQMLFNLIGANTEMAGGLVSYLLFEGSYCQALIDLGEKDALDQADTLKRILGY